MTVQLAFRPRPRPHTTPCILPTSPPIRSFSRQAYLKTKPSPTRKTWTHRTPSISIDYNQAYKPLGREALIQAQQAGWPKVTITAANIARRPKKGLWWLATANSSVSSKCTMRIHQQRRLQTAFRDALASRGYTPSGLVKRDDDDDDASSSSSADPKEQELWIRFGIKAPRSPTRRTQSLPPLKGTVNLYALPPIIKTPYATLRHDMLGVVQKLIQHAQEARKTDQEHAAEEDVAGGGDVMERKLQAQRRIDASSGKATPVRPAIRLRRAVGGQVNASLRYPHHERSLDGA